MQAIATVATEVLVAAVAGQRHRDVATRQLADAVRGQRRAVGVRLVVNAASVSMRSKSSLSTWSTKWRVP